MNNLQWKANVFLNPDGFRNKKENYGFKTRRAPDPVPELQWFKDKMYDLAKNLEFRPYSNEFLTKLDKDIREMNSNDKVTDYFIFSFSIHNSGLETCSFLETPRSSRLNYLRSSTIGKLKKTKYL